MTTILKIPYIDDGFEKTRYSGKDLITKAGIIPFCLDGEKIKYLFASPKPVRNPEDFVPFAPARGTRRMKIGGNWQDIRTEEDKALIEKEQGKIEIEPLWQTACIEGEEELGLAPKDIQALYDCGVVSYKNYGINFFMAHIFHDVVLKSAKDSKEVHFMSEEDVEMFLSKGEFNKKYMPILENAFKMAKHIMLNKQ